MIPSDELIWRIGHVSDPWAYPPPEYRRCLGRFDDPELEFGTLYCAPKRTVCFAEILAPMRPTTLARAAGAPRPVVDIGLRETRVLVAGRPSPRDDRFVDLTPPAARHAVESRHATLLATHGLNHLDLTDVSTRARAATQALARVLYDEGVRGVRYPSNPGDGDCLALFEGRAVLMRVGDPQSLTADIPELVAVASDFDIDITPPPTP